MELRICAPCPVPEPTCAMMRLIFVTTASISPSSVSSCAAHGAARLNTLPSFNESHCLALEERHCLA